MYNQQNQFDCFGSPTLNLKGSSVGSKGISTEIEENENMEDLEIKSSASHVRLSM